MREIRRIGPRLLGALALFMVSGCGLVGDLFNEDAVRQLGLDPATVFGEDGTVIVALYNTTRVTADFNAWWSLDASNLTAKSRNFSVEVEGGAVKNEVLQCPIGVISPGSLDANFVASDVAVVLDSGEQVTYTGPVLLSGSSFLCGDVIEIRLLPIGGTSDTQEYAVSVRVIRGR